MQTSVVLWKCSPSDDGGLVHHSHLLRRRLAALPLPGVEEERAPGEQVDDEHQPGIIKQSIM